MHSQCTITDLVVTNSECDENDKFSIEIDFEYDEIGQNGFQILGNGNNYGIFQYENLPITIDGLIGNCEIEFEFIVRDVDDPTCATFNELGTVCCDDVCQLEIIEFETSDCDSNVTYGISFDLEYAFEGDEGISVSVNGEIFGEYSYEDLPLTIDNIMIVEEGLNTFMVCDNEFPDCCATYDFLNPCICGMNNITSDIIDCSIDDSTYYVIVNFDHVATNDSFQMGYSNNGTNTFLGTFAYSDLPVTAGPIFLSEEEQEILIVDTEDFFCFSTAYLGRVDDCDIACQLFNVFAEAYMCEEGEYFMDFSFEAEDLEGSTFEALVDGVSYGTFEYGEGLYTIGPIPSNCDTPPVLVIQDSEVEFCSDFFNFTEPICCLPECNFISLETSTTCGPTTLLVNGSFENNGIMLVPFFFVQIGGTSYGPFPYGDFTFEIEIPLLADGEYDITVNDGNDPACLISSTFEVQCDEEPCLIFDVFAEAQECEENQFFVDVEFEFAGEVSDSFTITGNGMNYGTFAYGPQFFTVGPLEGDCETLYEFVVSDQIMEGCNAFYAFDEPVCCDNACRITDITITEFTCDDESFLSSIVIDFEYENTSENFRLFFNGIEYGTYPYSGLPLTIEEELPTNLVIQVSDSEITGCQSIEEIEIDCTDDGCDFDQAGLSIVDCSEESGTYFLELTSEQTDAADSLVIYIDDFLVATIDITELPYVIGPFDLGELYHVFVNDSKAGEECEISFPIFFEICDTGLEDASFENVRVIQSMNSLISENNEAERLKFQLINTPGALISTWNLESNGMKTLDTSPLPNGLYLLNISNDRYQKTMKIVIF